VETESRLDDVVFEEFKGTGNMEVRLDRELAERRVYPAIHIPQSGTRNDDRLYHPDEFRKVVDVRKQLAGLPIGDALVMLLENLKKTKTNAEFLLRGLR
jgi:transcription termination factor Rho